MASWGTVKLLPNGRGEDLGNCFPWTTALGNSFPASSLPQDKQFDYSQETMQ